MSTGPTLRLTRCGKWRSSAAGCLCCWLPLLLAASAAGWCYHVQTRGLLLLTLQLTALTPTPIHTSLFYSQFPLPLRCGAAALHAPARIPCAIITSPITHDGKRKLVSMAPLLQYIRAWKPNAA